MERIKYDPSEFQMEYAEGMFGSKTPIFHTPCTPRENFLALFNGENPLWMPLSSDAKFFCSRVDPDNIARGFVFDGEGAYDREKYGGPDMFGIEWVFVPVVGGSMENPDNPHIMEDANEWRDVIKFPDVNAWDWAGHASAEGNLAWFEKNKDYDISGMLLNGFGFERLVSFMGFENAAMAIIDDDQIDAVKELCNEICEKVYIPYVDNLHKYFPGITHICLHDDWGSQRAPFFSLNAARDAFVEVYQKFNAHLKSLGLISELHSCGKNDLIVPGYIESGFETWNGMYMNDKRNLFELYGDKFIFAVDPPEIATDMNAGDEELWAAAKEFCEFFIRDGKCRTIANCMRTNPKFTVDVYRISREMLSA